jgi:starch synthase
MAAAEVAPLAKTGGLGDVLGALPRALQQSGVRTTVVMPAYSAVRQSGCVLEPTGWEIAVPVSNRTVTATVLRTQLADGVPVYCIEADAYFARPGLYGTSAGDYPDNAERFVFFSRAVLALLAHIDVPDVLHVHDWQAALALAFLRVDAARYPHLGAVRGVVTIHNIGYQGQFWHHDWHLLNLDWSHFTPDGLELYGHINFLKGGVVFADAVTTVSPTYAREIQTPEYGYLLDGVLRHRRDVLSGILNGVDYDEWDPARDALIAARYSAADLSGKARCKAALQTQMGLAVEPQVPIIGIVSRLAEQKGLDLVAQIAPSLLERQVQIVILGKGDPRLESIFGDLARQHPEWVAARIGFDNRLAHQIEAGSDLFLMPSRYEPCGLNQMYSLRYGTIPIVRATGGLADSVIDADADPLHGNGFQFGEYSDSALLACVDRALRAYRQPHAWGALMQRAMRADFSWQRSASQYRELYEGLIL